jgi:3-oxoacyl-[acyl-carrier-protein] synthase III
MKISVRVVVDIIFQAHEYTLENKQEIFLNVTEMMKKAGYETTKYLGVTRDTINVTVTEQNIQMIVEQCSHEKWVYDLADSELGET